MRVGTATSTASAAVTGPGRVAVRLLGLSLVAARLGLRHGSDARFSSDADFVMVSS